ncbi:MULTISPECIES: PilN domain-containing protein [Trichocoleus]|uniref:PilN domain-containing protein n=1 Tax=Trichocoleus desertorum GB2-A4 TaxID=2933944 RepID=A0ABV0J887_9CYAN|nr:MULTISPECIES: PilN domain-containing protein [unclassified Trichocoleus]MBD1861002.1 PilN domain-containing protein [Trichocoleus sp. FACHB-46]MBD2094205.1 PilN domain-containing protein [Trichocoleus sp. FACHB-591]
MYSLDVNFLNDRPEYRPDVGGGPSRPKAAPGSLVPLFLGVATGVFLPAVVLVLWLVLQNKNAELQTRIDQLNVQLGELQRADEKVAAINAQAGQIKAETDALATVFNQIKPWSAMLQDIRDRVPAGVQVSNIQQTDAPAATPQSPNPAPKVEISGAARSFNDVNDFLLTLQKSPFLKASETQLVGADLRDNPTQIEVRQDRTPQSSTPDVQVKLPQVVVYKIQTSLSDVPASELLRELDRKGAVGLVTRIRTLQQKGVIQP